MSKILNSVRIHSTPTMGDLPVACPDDCKRQHEHKVLFTFDKAHKNTLSNRKSKNNAKTVAEIQGVRQEEIALFITHNCMKLLEVHGQLLVAFTRHTRELNIYMQMESYKLKPQFQFDEVTCGCRRVGSRTKRTTIYGKHEVTGVRFTDGEKLKGNFKRLGVQDDTSSIEKVFTKLKISGNTRQERINQVRGLIEDENGERVLNVELPVEFQANKHQHDHENIAASAPMDVDFDDYDREEAAILDDKMDPAPVGVDTPEEASMICSTLYDTSAVMVDGARAINATHL